MAIKLTALEQISKNVVDTKYLYKDIRLDITASSRYDHTSSELVPQNDIAVDYDELAIKNSIRNLFTTRPGQRFLFPRYGLDLRQFLFEPLTDTNADFIRDTIILNITTYEKRVTVLECNVVPKYDDNAYEISIFLEIVSLRRSVPIYSVMDLKTQRFSVLDNLTK